MIDAVDREVAFHIACVVEIDFAGRTAILAIELRARDVRALMLQLIHPRVR